MDIINQLNEWHERNEHQKIIDAVEQTPARERGFEITGMYARALNNAGRYQEAFDQLMAVEEYGRGNGVWNFRVGYSLYYMDRSQEAAEYFQRAVDFGDDCPDTRDMLKMSLESAPWDSLHEYIHKYIETADKYPDDKITDHLNSYQITLWVYALCCAAIVNGGFIRIIQNKYSEYIFNTPFPQILAVWGAEKAGGIVDKACAIYNEHKDELERPLSKTEALKLHKKIKDFRPLEEMFCDVMADETRIIQKYVENNTEEFDITV
jgi:tetratricopeptide (TPR) repeat protein